ncbi:MAG: hypothetical protein GY863_18050 [bacterium]|nr:hypothetical protein [bacterium]
MTLLCGGISLQLEEIIKYLGINVIPWVSGYANEILNSFLEGTLVPGEHFMPGVKKIKKKRFQVNDTANPIIKSECLENEK